MFFLPDVSFLLGCYIHHCGILLLLDHHYCPVCLYPAVPEELSLVFPILTLGLPAHYSVQIFLYRMPAKWHFIYPRPASIVHPSPNCQISLERTLSTHRGSERCNKKQVPRRYIQMSIPTPLETAKERLLVLTSRFKRYRKDNEARRINRLVTTLPEKVCS